MPASPLAAALIGGQDAGMVGADPAMIEAMPQINLAKALMTSGTDTSGASPMQALARVAQAFAGQSIMSDATKSLANAYANSAESMAKTLEQVSPGHPLISALRSPDLATRMTAAKEYGKAMTLLGEPYTVSAGQQRFPGSGVQQGQPVAQSTAPQSEPGKVAADTARNPAAPAVAANAAALKANAEAAGQATGGVGLSLGGGPFGANTTIVGGGAGSRPGAAPGGAAAPSQGTTPPGAQPSSLPDKLAAAKANLAGQLKAAENAAEFGDVVSPSGRTTPQGQGPGLTEPMTTKSGTTIPPVSDQPLPTNYAQAKPSVDAWQKKSEELSSGLKEAQSAEQRLNTIAQAFKSFQTGSYATNKAEILTALKSAGIDIPYDMDPAAVQTSLHENYVETLQQLKAASSRFTQMEFAKLSQNREHPNLQPAANLQMLSEDIGTLRQAQRLADDWQTAQGKGWKNSINFEAQWLKANPLPSFVSQARQDIGPLKGMPGAPEQGGQGGGAPGAAPALATRVINGKTFHGYPGTSNWWEGHP